MTDDLIQAATALTDILARENQALIALDLSAAVALLDEKHHATDAFIAAHARLRAADKPVGHRAQAKQTAQRLRDQAEQNRRLLEHAITVQSRVIGLLTRGVPRALTRTSRYDAGGALAQARSMPPVTLSARA